MGPLPYGDPAGMRAMATAIRQRAALINAVSEEVRQRAESMDFEGPAADRFHWAVIQRIQAARAIADALTATAERLLQEAGFLDAAILQARLAGG